MNENEVRAFGKNCIILSSIILVISVPVSIVIALNNDIGSVLPVLFVMALLCGTCIWGIVRGYKRIREPGKYIQAQAHVAFDPADRSNENEFRAYKSKWAWDDAAMEYCRIIESGYEEIPEEDEDKIFEYASMPAAYFMMWLVENDLMSEIFYGQIAKEEINRLKAREISPVEFFVGNMDCCLLRDEISEKVLPFVDGYFETVEEKGYLNFRNPDMSDYYQCIRNENSFYYCVEFSWDTYDMIREKIDDAYGKYRSDNSI